MADALVWISGATGGLGAALAATVPFSDRRVINLSRREARGLENLRVDLTDRADWERAASSFERELASFDGSTALFVHNAFLDRPFGFAGEVDDEDYVDHLVANAVASLYLGHRFVRAAAGRPFETGLVALSSLAARVPFPGAACYSASKAAVEMWVRSVASERERRGTGPWVLAVRPGTVDTPASRQVAELDSDTFPAGRATRDAFELGEVEEPLDVARKIWGEVLARPPSGTVVKLGAPPSSFGQH